MVTMITVEGWGGGGGCDCDLSGHFIFLKTFYVDVINIYICILSIDLLYRSI